MKKMLMVLILLVACLGTSVAQTGVVPMTLNVGPIAGIALPTGDLGTAASLGWNAGVQARFGNLLPFSLNAAFTYSSLAAKDLPATFPSFNYTIWSLSVGPEYVIPAVGMTPYLGADLMYNMLGTSLSGSTSSSRFGLGLGGGIQFSEFDASAKYQMLNLVGKDTGEGTNSMIVVRVAYMFPAL